MSNIPEARRILTEVETALREGKCSRSDAAVLISEALSMMTRERMARRAPEKSRKITPDIRARILQMARTNMHQDEIGRALGINHGCVSEVLNGKR